MKTLAKAILRRRKAIFFALVAALGLALAGVHIYEATNDSVATDTLSLATGATLAYTKHDAAEPGAVRVILLHGAPANSSSWNRLLEEQAEALADYEIVAVDRLGYGASSPRAELSIAAHVDSIEPLLTPGCVLVGHSYGGPVALRAAAEHPGLVSGLVLVAGATDPTMNDAQWARKAVDAVSILLPKAWANANLELLALTDENDQMQPLLEGVTARTAALHGKWDPVCPYDGTTAHLQTALTAAGAVRVETVPRGGHNLHLSDTEALADLIAWTAGDQTD